MSLAHLLIRYDLPTPTGVVPIVLRASTLRSAQMFVHRKNRLSPIRTAIRKTKLQ
jgi:hypothetical protein